MAEDLFVDDFTAIDRSTLERYANCPAQARLLEDSGVQSVGSIAEAGEQVHVAIGQTIQSYIDSRGSLNVLELSEELENNLSNARPDVQPMAIRGFRASIYPFCRFLCGIHYQNVLRYDGGEGEQSGQLASDIAHLAVRVTSEVDFLFTPRSPETVCEIDWKSGWKSWTADEVERSFQFRMHAYLIFENYPDVQVVQIAVWDTRRNNRTPWVEWRRRDVKYLAAQITGAAGEYIRWNRKPPESAPAWPAREKCRICAVASQCPAADTDISIATQNPGGLVDRMVATEEALSAMKKQAWSIVEATGQDIVSENGNAFGWGKPKTARKPTNPLYSVSEGE